MKKFIKIASIITALSIFAGCKTQLNSNIESASAYIKVSTDDNSSRTIEPTYEYDKSDFIYELWGIREGSYRNVKLGTWLSYDAMSKAEAIKLEPDTWTFELMAYKENVLELSGSLEKKEIKAGQSTLKFTLSDQKGPDGYGKIDYKFYFAKPMKDNGYADIALYNLNGTRYTTPESDVSEANVKNEVITETKDDVEYRCITYTNDKIAKGFYVVKINVYDNNYSYKKLLNTYTTTIRVANDMTSTGEEYLTKRNYVASISDIVPELQISDLEKMNWSYVETAVSYEIYKYESEKDLPVEGFDTSLFTESQLVYSLGNYDISTSRKVRKNVYYAIKAVDDSGKKSAFSNVVMIPKGLQPAYLSFYGNLLKVRNVADADKYEVYSYSTKDFYQPSDIDLELFADEPDFTINVSKDNSVTSLEILPDLTNYRYYVVKAVSGKEKSPFSSVCMVRPFTSPELYLAGTTVWWVPVDTATSYKVYRYTSTDVTDMNISDPELFLTEFAEVDDNSITHEVSLTEYTCYAVKGFNGELETDFSNVIVVAPFLPPVISINEKGIVSWSPVSGATSYRICYFSSETKIDLSTIDFSTRSCSYFSSSSTSYTLTASMTNYLYCAVQAYYDGLYTDFSNVVEFEKFDTVADYLSLVKGAAYGEAYTVQENDSTNIEDFTLVEWSSSAGTFLSFAVEPNTTYYLDGVDNYNKSIVNPSYSGQTLNDAYYDIYSDVSTSSVYISDSPSNTYFTTSATASTYYIVVRPFGSSNSGKAYFRIYKKTTN